MIKSTIVDGKVQKDVTFPALYQGVTTHQILLFTSEFEGTVVRQGNFSGAFPVGTVQKGVASCLNDPFWKEFTGTLELVNT